MSVRTPQPVIDEIHRLLRETQMPLREIGVVCGVSATTVAYHAKAVEPEFRRSMPPMPSPELQMAIVADAIDGMTRAEAARRNGVTWDVASGVYHRHRETIEAGRTVLISVATPCEPVNRKSDWIAEDPALKRSIDRLRTAPGILPEFA